MNRPESDPDRPLSGLSRELRRRHGCHTAILYGSRATDKRDSQSDYDVVGFRTSGGRARVVQRERGIQLDLFIYPDEKLDQPDQSLLRLRGGRVLFEADGRGTALLRQLEVMHAAGPARLPADELKARSAWALKTLERIKAGDVEGNYRRVILLVALLEDYFHFRGLWYEGSKKSFAWLREHDPETLAAFERALQPHAPQADIRALVRTVVSL